MSPENSPNTNISPKKREIIDKSLDYSKEILPNEDNNTTTTSPHEYPFGPPTLYCDGVHIIRKVNEINGKFIGLKKGDHLMVPLNLARGLVNVVDSIVDVVADYDLIQFHHHFVCLDDVASLKGDDCGYVAEFTNTPEDFVENANRIGWSSAFLDKASYRKTPLSSYKGSLIFKVDEEHPLSDIQRNKIVERANHSILKSSSNDYPRYNFFTENCEHATSDVLQKEMLSNTDIILNNMMNEKQLNLLKQKGILSNNNNNNNENNNNMDVNQSKNKNDKNLSSQNENKTIKENEKENTQVTDPSQKGSPQVTFAIWNTFRFSLQVLGIIFLYQIKTTKWWFWAAIIYCIFSAVPVFMQSIANLFLTVYKLRVLFQRGSLKKGSFRHLLLKEIFRCILVGFGSSLIIILMPIAVWSHYWPLSIASLFALFSYVVLNSVYSVLVKAIHKLILFIKKMIKKYQKMKLPQNNKKEKPSPVFVNELNKKIN